MGDDTTAIAGGILAHMGVRVVGIANGNIDLLSNKTMMPKGSLIIRVKPYCNDIVGRRIRSAIFHSGKWACECLVEGIIETEMDQESKDIIHIDDF